MSECYTDSEASKDSDHYCSANAPIEIDHTVDHAIIKRIQLGEHAALAELYDRYAALMLGVAMRILQNQRDAEDLLHDVFLEVWRTAQSYDSTRGTVRTWLLLRVRSRALDRLRSLRLARDHAMVAPITESGSAESDDPSHASDHAHARRVINTLSQEQRTVLELSYFEGLTCSEIAKRCGIPIGTVKSRMAAAMVKLRQRLKPTR